MPAVAVTDHGNMFGAIALYKAAKEAKVRAILGCELDVCSRSGAGHHLPLLAASSRDTKTSSGWSLVVMSRRSKGDRPGSR